MQAQITTVTFSALAFQLPDLEQQTLKDMAANIRSARIDHETHRTDETKEAFQKAVGLLDGYTANLRETIGRTITRPWISNFARTEAGNGVNL